MNIILNGTRRSITSTTVADVLVEIELGQAHVATALNGNFLPASQRASTTLNEGDTLEVLSPMQGG